jgi:hypothetical protein
MRNFFPIFLVWFMLFLSMVVTKEARCDQEHESEYEISLIITFAEQAPPLEIQEETSIALTGIESVDQLNRKFKVRAIEKMSDEPEERNGLPMSSRIYRFIFPSDADVSAIGEAYGADSNIKSVEQRRYIIMNARKDYFPDQFFVRFSPDAPELRIESRAGVVVTGIPSVDGLNRKFKVSSIERMFPEQVSGLLGRLYKFRVPLNSDIISIVREYEFNAVIEQATPIYFTGGSGYLE